jgi:hypothetical protein
MKKFLIATSLVFIAVPAFAQTATPTEFYVVQDTATKKCTVVDRKPTATTMIIVENGTFKTKTEAETGMKTIKVCNN